ncbi:MAG: hypothetical protein V3V18_06035 [Methylococcales bacterium]
MKTKYLTTSFISTLLLASSSVVLAEPNYPEDFTPEIVYQDKDYIAEHGGSAPSASPSPSTSSSSSGSSSSSNSELPGDFTPEIVYQDKDYIANTKSNSSSPVKKSSISSSTSASSSTTSDSSSSETDASPEESGGMSQYLIGLGVLLAVGAFLYSRRPTSEGSQSSAPAPAHNVASGGGTGVANYLKQNDMAEATGVAKYLDQQTIANATGVEKFLRDRG